MQLLTNRLQQQKRIIIKKNILPNLLCYCIKNGLGGVGVKIINTNDSVIINVQ